MKHNYVGRNLSNLLKKQKHIIPRRNHFQSHLSKTINPLIQNPNSSSSSSLLSGFFPPRHHFFSTITTADVTPTENHLTHYDSNDEVEPIDLWEEEDETDPEIGDGGSGGGVVFQNCTWGEKALSIAQEVLVQFGDDIEIFAFKTSPRGYIYVRLDRLYNEYGCPSMEDIQRYNNEYKKRLDEAGAAGDIPNDLALEVSSPGADRLLRKPDDLRRFKDMAMRVKYVEHGESKSLEKEGVFFLEAIDMESGICVWRLADVKENRSPLSKGRPMTRKQKDWRLELPYDMLKQVTLYLDYQ